MMIFISHRYSKIKDKMEGYIMKSLYSKSLRLILLTVLTLQASSTVLAMQDANDVTDFEGFSADSDFWDTTPEPFIMEAQKRTFDEVDNSNGPEDDTLEAPESKYQKNDTYQATEDLGLPIEIVEKPIESISPTQAHVAREQYMNKLCIKCRKYAQKNEAEIFASGITPLQIAIIKNHPRCVKKLLNNGANPNEKDNDGWTALHYVAAADTGSPIKESEKPYAKKIYKVKTAIEIMILLLQAEANPNITDNDGHNPWYYTIDKKIQKRAAMLEYSMAGLEIPYDIATISSAKARRMLADKKVAKQKQTSVLGTQSTTYDPIMYKSELMYKSKFTQTDAIPSDEIVDTEAMLKTLYWAVSIGNVEASRSLLKYYVENEITIPFEVLQKSVSLGLAEYIETEDYYNLIL